MNSNLCKTCQAKQADKSVRGQCLSPSWALQGKLPSDHEPWTDSPSFSLCDACAQHFKICAWCLGPLDGQNPVSVPTDKTFSFAYASDNGGVKEDMYVGEQVVVQFVVDRFSGITWKPDKLTNGIKLAVSRTVPIGSNWGRYAYLEFYFDLPKAAPSAQIVLMEAPASTWISIANPKTWSLEVEILQ